MNLVTISTWCKGTIQNLQTTKTWNTSKNLKSWLLHKWDVLELECRRRGSGPNDGWNEWID
jgi:hypothetical protein